MCYSQAWNIIGESPWSEEASFMTQATVPSAPEALSCTADGATTVLVAWQEPADGGAPINAYQLQMDDGEGGDFQLLYNGDICQHLAANLRSGLGYRFRVLAENEVGVVPKCKYRYSSHYKQQVTQCNSHDLRGSSLQSMHYTMLFRTKHTCFCDYLLLTHYTIVLCSYFVVVLIACQHDSGVRCDLASNRTHRPCLLDSCFIPILASAGGQGCLE